MSNSFRFTAKSSNNDITHCNISNECQICDFINKPYQSNLKYKFDLGIKKLTELLGDSFKKTKNLSITPAIKTKQYRCLFKLAVRPAENLNLTDENCDRFAIGLFKPNSHDVVDVTSCILLTPSLYRLLADIKILLENTDIEPYNEKNHTGNLRYIGARAAHKTNEIQLTFVDREKKYLNSYKQMLSDLQQLGHKVKSAHLDVHPDAGNAIYSGNKTIKLTRSEYLRESVCGLNYNIGSTSFFQINPWQAENIYRRIETLVGPAQGNSVAWDFYCGVGQISLVLARSGYKVIGIEENPVAIDNAIKNAKSNMLTKNTDFIASRLEDIDLNVAKFNQVPDVIVVNPSRRGLAHETALFISELLVTRPQTKFIYVSCDINTLSRDLDVILNSKLTLRQIEGFDMFPQTKHLEWLAVITS